MKKVTTNITFGQVLFILLTVVFASASFFYLGAKFGRQVLNIADSVTDDSQPLLPDEKVSEEIKKILAEEPPQFTFHDVLDEHTNYVPIPKTKTVETVVKTTPPVSLKVNTEPVKLVTEKKKQTEEDLLKIKTAPIETAQKTNDVVAQTTHLLDDPVAMSVPQKQYRLQVGSFSDKKKAQTSQAIWQARGYSVSMVSSEIPGKGTWFKLYVGGFTSMDDVTAAQKKILNQYKQSAMILQ